MRSVGWLLVLLVGIGIGILIEKQIEKTRPRAEIFVDVDRLAKKALLNPQQGDVIHFRTALKGSAIQPVVPTWPWGSPCEKTGAACKVVADHHMYAYDCPVDTPCDPEVPIGSDIVPLRPAGPGRDPSGTPVEVQIGCNGSNAAVNPTTVTAQASSNYIFWRLLGDAPTWDVAWAGSAMICQDPLNQGQTVCNITAGADTYHYTATVGSCTGNKTVIGTVIIN